MHYLFYGSIQETGNVVTDFIIKSGREVFLQLGKLVLYGIDNITGITAKSLFQNYGSRRFTIQIGINIKKFAAQLYIGQITKFQDFTIFVGLDDNFLVLLGFVISVLIHQHILKGLGGLTGALSDPTRSGQNTLLLHCFEDFLGRDIVSPHTVRF